MRELRELRELQNSHFKLSTLLIEKLKIDLDKDDGFNNFYHWLKSKLKTELNEPLLKPNSDTGIRLEIPTTNCYFYTDLKFSEIKNSEILINFNDIFGIIKKIITGMDLSGFLDFGETMQVDTDLMDDICVIIRGIYYYYEQAAEAMGKRVFIYIPDVTSWVTANKNTAVIYGILSDLFLYANLLIESEERLSLFERIATNQSKTIFFILNINTGKHTLENSLVLKFSSSIRIKGEDREVQGLINLPDTLEFFKALNEQVQVLKDGCMLLLKLKDTSELKRVLNQTFIDLTVDEYYDWVFKLNTQPKELEALRASLSAWQNLLAIVDENNAASIEQIKEQCHTIGEKISSFEIEYISVRPETFMEFLNTKGFNFIINDKNKDKLQIEDTIKNFDRKFRERILGQDQAIKPIWAVLKKWYIGIRTQKPIASFLLCGPTGVGKTETAKLLAQTTFDNLITLDMSEYQTEIDATKIIGVAPGYAGYDQGAGILDKIAETPRTVILFDEIEKAHYKIFDLLLQVLDEGRLTDHKGTVVSFSECLVLCTTNAHYEEIEHLGDGTRSKVNEILSKSFRKELLGRFTDIIKYSQLNDKTLMDIFDMKVDKKIEELCKTNNKELILIEDDNFYKLKDSIISWMDNSLGARELDRLIEEKIIGPILDELVHLQLEKIEEFNSSNKITFWYDVNPNLQDDQSNENLELGIPMMSWNMLVEQE